MNNVQIFKNSLFGEVRVDVSENNEPLFHATDVARALRYANTAEAVATHCKSNT